MFPYTQYTIEKTILRDINKTKVRQYLEKKVFRKQEIELELPEQLQMKMVDQTKGCYQNDLLLPVVVRTQLNIYTGAFSENSERLHRRCLTKL